MATNEEVATAKRLAQYRRIRPEFQSDRKEIVTVVDAIIDEMLAHGLIKKVSEELRQSLTAIILNLQANHLDDTLVGINLGKNWFEKYKWTREKQSKGEGCLPRYWKYSTVTNLEKNLQELGLIERAATGYKSLSEGTESQITKIQGTEKLFELFQSRGLEPYMVMADLGSRDDEGLIILKDSHKNPIKIPKRLEAEAKTHRDILRKINSALQKHLITLNITDAELEQLKDRRALKRIVRTSSGKKTKRFTNPSTDFIWDKKLYRVFHGDFEHHGRFYGGFWETLPNKERWKDTNHHIRNDGIEFRRRIEIDGEETVEVDYSSMHTRLLYHIKGIDYPHDPYKAVVKHVQKINGKKVLRKQVKSALNIMINAKEGDDVPAIVANVWNSGDDKETTMNHDFARQLLDAINEVHSPIKEYFYSGTAKELMNLDSRIAENVMISMIEQYQTVALPVHDSFIVQKKHENDLRDAMQQAYREVTGGKSMMKFEQGDSSAANIYQRSSGMAYSYPVSLSERIDMISNGIESERKQCKWRNEITVQLQKALDESK